LPLLSRFGAIFSSPSERMPMPTIEVSAKELLEAVKQMPPEEFDAFIEQALSLRAQPRGASLSAEETQLILRINRGLPEAWCKRYAQLSQRRKKGKLTAAEHEELLKLTHEAESRDADRAAALLELAKLRRLPMRVLMKQMGIQAQPIHG
jgi:hypothetical protein